MAAGDFTASQMPKILARQRQIFLGGSRIDSQRSMNSQLNALRAVLENQTARPIPVMTGNKCTAVDVTWLKACSDTVVDGLDEGYTFSCDISCTEMESVKQTIAPNFQLKACVKVNDDECNDLFTAEQKIAEGALNAKLAIEKELSSRITALLYANLTPATVYGGEEPTGWDLSGNPFYYDGTVANRPLTLSQMYVISQVMGIQNPIMIGDGTWQADLNLANFLNNQGGAVYNEAGLFGQWGRWYFDPINLTGLSADYGKLFMVDPNNILVWAKNDTSNGQPERFVNDTYKWQEPSMNFPSLKYDVYMKETCIEGAGGLNSRAKGIDIEYTLTGGIALSEASCVTGDTGVLYFGQDMPT